MEKEDIALLAQLFIIMKDILDKLEEAQKKKDVEKANAVKKEILNFQNQIDKLL